MKSIFISPCPLRLPFRIVSINLVRWGKKDACVQEVRCLFFIRTRNTDSVICPASDGLPDYSAIRKACSDFLNESLGMNLAEPWVNGSGAMKWGRGAGELARKLLFLSCRHPLQAYRERIHGMGSCGPIG
jgi:hypothetical protein